MASGKICLAAKDFVISCGTATFDTNVEPMPVLLIQCRGTGEWLLPKGRKDIGETLQQAAERETFEETSYRASILPSHFETRATGALEPRETITEPVAMTQRISDGVLKTIFWFVASGDSNASKVSDTQQDGEDFDSHWISLQAALTKLSWPDDRFVLEQAAKAIENLGSRSM